MFTLGAYYESIDPAGAWTELAAVPDTHLTVSGDNILVPELNQLLAYAMLVDQTVAAQGRLRSPSLVSDGFEEYIQPLESGLTFAALQAVINRSRTPIALTPVEALQCHVNSNPAAAIGHYGLVWLGDGPVTPVTGRIRTIRATGAATLAAGTWVNTALTFPVSLKAGKYQVVGLRVLGANLVAARLFFPGTAWRPGAPAVNDEPDYGNDLFRNGNMGVWGEFAHSSPPTMDCLGVTDTAQEVFLDVIFLG